MPDRLDWLAPLLHFGGFYVRIKKLSRRRVRTLENYKQKDHEHRYMQVIVISKTLVNLVKLTRTKCVCHFRILAQQLNHAVLRALGERLSCLG